MDQDVWIVQLDRHFFGVGDEIWRQVTAVKLHTFDNFELAFTALSFFDGNNAFLADLLHGVCNHLTDFSFTICRDRTDLCDFRRTSNWLRTLNEVSNNSINRCVDAALEVHWVHTRCNRLHAFANNRLCKNSGSGRAVTGNIVGLRSNFANHLRAHIFELVFQFDFLGDGNAVLSDPRCAKAFVDDNITAFWTKCYFYSVSKNVYAAQDAFTRIAAEFHVFSSHDIFPLIVCSSEGWVIQTIRRLGNDSQDIRFLHDQQVFAVDLDFGARPFAEQNFVASLNIKRRHSAVFCLGTCANGDDFAFLWLFLSCIRDNDPASGFCFGLDPTDENAIMQWTKCHMLNLPLIVRHPATGQNPE